MALNTPVHIPMMTLPMRIMNPSSTKQIPYPIIANKLVTKKEFLLLNFLSKKELDNAPIMAPIGTQPVTIL
jgi:hypothetical protein